MRWSPRSLPAKSNSGVRMRFALLAEGSEKYALSPGFIDYMTTFFNYKWADKTVSYPEFSFENGRLVRRMSPDGSP